MGQYSDQDKHNFRHTLTPYEKEALDVGSPSRRFRTMYAASLLVDTGTFVSIVSGGTVTINGVTYVFPGSQGGASTVLTNDGLGNLSWGSGTSYSNLFQDGVNGLAERNGVNSQSFIIYNTFTDAANYERGFFRYVGNVLQIGHEALGTGNITRSIRFLTAGGQQLFSIAESGGFVNVTTSGMLVFGVDNSNDIGASGATRPRDIYLGTSIRIGAIPASQGAVRLSNNTYVYARNQANGADKLVVGVNATDQLVTGIWTWPVADAAGALQSNGAGVLSISAVAPVDAQYLTLATNATLTNERVLTAGTGITLTDSGAGGTLTIDATAPGFDFGKTLAFQTGIARF